MTAARARGVSLVESIVVLMIGVVLLFSLWPVATGLLPGRREMQIYAAALSKETGWTLILGALVHAALAYYWFVK